MYDLTYRPSPFAHFSRNAWFSTRNNIRCYNWLIYSLFIAPGEGIKKKIDTLPGQYHLSSVEWSEGGTRSRRPRYSWCRNLWYSYLWWTRFLLLGYGATGEQQAIKAIRKAVLNLVIADVCLCQYTPVGHCGMIDHHEWWNTYTGCIGQAQAAHMVVPSDMRWMAA